MRGDRIMDSDVSGPEVVLRGNRIMDSDVLSAVDTQEPPASIQTHCNLALVSMSLDNFMHRRE